MSRVSFRMRLFGLLLVACLHFCVGDDFHFDPESEDNKAHLQDDLDGHIDKKVSEMDANELQFHYFKQHDYDNNQKLDGTELMSKLYQTELDNWNRSGEDGVLSLKDDLISEKIDGYLNSADSNKDGYVDFAEFKRVVDLKIRK